MASKRIEDTRLPPEHEAELWRRVHDGSQTARGELIEAYMPFARILSAKLYAARTHDEFEFDEYLQYANVGLLESVDRFDPSRGAQFRTFAAYRIQGSILNGLERSSERQQQLSARRALLGPRLEDIKADAEADNRGSFDVLRSLAEIGIGLALGFMLEGALMIAGEGTQQQADSAYSRIEMRQMQQRIAALVKELPPRECDLISLHYLQGVPFEQIARDWALSRGRVSQLHGQALKRLRTMINADRMCNVEF
ncbi:MAG: sigma-70 family RNA polymerase sigma factor [Rhodocyclaceae bacterium]